MYLQQFLRKNQYTRKVFGQRELKIIEKQLLGINLTQSEKNRLSRDIRKKLEFIKEIARFAEEFDLKKGATLRRQIQKALQVIKEDKFMLKISKIILFGSTVERTRSFRSDIDMAIKFSQISTEEAFTFRRRILGELEEKFDIQVYNTLPEKLKKEIDLKGKTIYERKN